MGHLGTGVSIDVNPGNAFKANLQSVLISIVAELPCEALLQEDYLAEVHGFAEAVLKIVKELHAATYSEWCSRK